MNMLKNLFVKDLFPMKMMYQQILLVHLHLMMTMMTSSRSVQSAQKGEQTLPAWQRPPGGRFPPRRAQMSPCPRLA